MMIGRIVVIGGTGITGAPVAGRLLAEGHLVRLLVRGVRAAAGEHGGAATLMFVAAGCSFLAAAVI